MQHNSISDLPAQMRRAYFIPRTPKKISGWVQNYGYIVETERYRYCLRCNPSPGDYNGYCTAYDLDVQRQNMAQKEVPHMEIGGMI